MQKIETVGIIGLGLIGGSMALALKERTSIRIAGFDRDDRTLQQAIDRNAVDAPLMIPGQPAPSLGKEAVLPRSCDLLLIALYPQAAIDTALGLLDSLRPGTLLVDLCGIKQCMQEALAAPCCQRGVIYFGAHPMAGREVSGFSSALPGLFRGASLILTPGADVPPHALADFEELMAQAGFGRFIHTTPQHHDRMIAYTSQLAHILSSAYIQNPLSSDYNGFTGGSFQDLTRVARLNGEMWGELFLKNQEFLCEQLDNLIDNLESYKQALATQDREELWRLMEKGTQIKNQLLQADSPTLLGE